MTDPITLSSFGTPTEYRDQLKMLYADKFRQRKIEIVKPIKEIIRAMRCEK